MIFRAIAGLMAALFAFAAAVNFNDPDPGRWIAIYTAACVVSLATAVARAVPIAVPSTVAIVALVWGILTAARVPNLQAYWQMFDAWEMKSGIVEEAREACGLFIVAVWMIALASRSLPSQR